MNVNRRLRELIIGAMLAALSTIIPVQFSFLRVVLPPFTATLTSHVPMFIAMMISPFAAVIAGIGSVMGFIFSGLDLVVAARAASHIFAGLVGALIVKRGGSMFTAFALALPVHAVFEALVVLPFGYNMYSALVVVGLGTAIHHAVDASISASILYALDPVLKLGLRKRKTGEIL